MESNKNWKRKELACVEGIRKGRGREVGHETARDGPRREAPLREQASLLRFLPVQNPFSFKRLSLRLEIDLFTVFQLLTWPSSGQSVETTGKSA